MVYALAAMMVLVTLTSVQGLVCKNDTECATDECCYIEPEFMVVSKRDGPMVMPVQIHTHHDTGVCEKYRSLHDSCGVFEKANGHCGCPTGTACMFVPAETILPMTVQPIKDLVVSKRKRSIFFPGPGKYQCETKAWVSVWDSESSISVILRINPLLHRYSL